MKLILSLLECSALFFIPILTFFGGLWFILRFLGINHRLALFFFALFVGCSFFEFSTIGMILDAPIGRLPEIGELVEIVKTSSIIGILAALSVLVIAYVYRLIYKIMK